MPLDILELDVLPPAIWIMMFRPRTFWTWMSRTHGVSSRDILDLDVSFPDVSDQDVSPPYMLNQDVSPPPPLIIVLLYKIYVSVESSVT